MIPVLGKDNPMEIRQIDAQEWQAAAAALDARGYAVIENLVPADRCASMAATYGRDELFRNRVVMARHNFGRGEYK